MCKLALCIANIHNVHFLKKFIFFLTVDALKGEDYGQIWLDIEV